MYLNTKYIGTQQFLKDIEAAGVSKKFMGR